MKYPRTHHLPWSPGMHDDDRRIDSLDAFDGKKVVVTVKMDGENTSMYRDAFHARSVDSRHHPSRDWAKQFWSTIAHDIPEGWRIVGENLYAEHSIHYDDLPTWFMGFSVWDDRNVCLSWDETLEWFELLGITPVEVLYEGIFDETKIREAAEKGVSWDRVEGYVVRTRESFPYGAFRTNVAKFVRAGHVQTVKHWMHGQPIVVNDLQK